MDALLHSVAGREATLEPELLLVVGHALTLNGFPPWVLRTSEIHHLAPSLSNVTAAAMAASLGRYGNTLQRLGT